MNRKRKVLVIGHQASLTGAPVLLLNLLRLLVEKNLIEVQFVISRNGPLVKEYQRLGPVIVLKPGDYGAEKNKLRHVANTVRSKIKLLIVLLKAFSCDYIFSNTIVNGKLLRWFYFHRKPIVTYIHEFEKAIDLYLKQGAASFSLTGSQIIAYLADVSRSLLVNKYKVPEQKLRPLSSYFPFTRKLYDPQAALDRSIEFRKKFGFSQDDFLVGGMGMVSDLKGIDLFIDTCKETVSRDRAIKFCWIGGFENQQQEQELQLLIQENELQENLVFTGQMKYDIYNLAPFDLFFLSSRQDTYPLVVLEAAMMKVPAICFSGSGGCAEFIGDDAGWVIDGFSINQAADKLVRLSRNREDIRIAGDIAFERVLERHCDASLALEQYVSIEERLGFNNSGPANR